MSNMDQQQQNVLVRKQNDTLAYLSRNDPSKNNANLYIANNANPFLISPYAPTNLTGFAKLDIVLDISSLVSSIYSSFNGVVDLNTFTLSISTIQPFFGVNSTLSITNLVN